MHSHVLHLQMHFVDTMHSEAYTLTYICTHSDAFDTVRILTHSYAYHSVPLVSLFCPTVRITTHSNAFVCILVASDLELARQAAVVGLRFVAAAAARLRRRPVFRVADVPQGVPGREVVVVVPFEHEDLLVLLLGELHVLNLLSRFGELLARPLHHT